MLNPLNATPKYMFTCFQVEESPSFVDELETYFEGTPVQVISHSVTTSIHGKLVEVSLCCTHNPADRLLVKANPTDWILVNNLTTEIYSLSDELYGKIFGVGGFSDGDKWFPGG